MGRVTYAPAHGDIVWLDFDVTRGHEQAGRRPALVISDTTFNTHFYLTFVCPITSRRRGHAFEVALHGTQTKGVVLAHQVRTIDVRGRRVRFVEKALPEDIEIVIDLVSRILGR